MIRKKADVLPNPRKALAFLEQLHRDGQPISLTINGKVDLLIEDAGSFQRLFDLVDRLEAIEGIKGGLESFERGEGRPARAALEELRRKHKKPRRET